MKALYDDIKKRIKEEVQWYDDNGCPRYDKFHPNDLSSIYADECCLLLIRCQQCHMEFKVSLYSISAYRVAKETLTIKEFIERGIIHYGDPPRHNSSCHAGDTMNCEDIRVLEYWKKEIPSDWKRNKELEIELNIE